MSFGDGGLLITDGHTGSKLNKHSGIPGNYQTTGNQNTGIILISPGLSASSKQKIVPSASNTIFELQISFFKRTVACQVSWTCHRFLVVHVSAKKYRGLGIAGVYLSIKHVLCTVMLHTCSISYIVAKPHVQNSGQP